MCGAATQRILCEQSRLITLDAFSGKRNVTVWRPFVRLSVCLSRRRIFNATHQGAPRDAASVIRDGHTCYMCLITAVPPQRSATHPVWSDLSFADVRNAVTNRPLLQPQANITVSVKLPLIADGSHASHIFIYIHRSSLRSMYLADAAKGKDRLFRAQESRCNIARRSGEARSFLRRSFILSGGPSFRLCRTGRQLCIISVVRQMRFVYRPL